MTSAKQVWSMWDMKELLASGIVSMAANLERVQVLLAEWETPSSAPFSATEKINDASLRNFLAKAYGHVAEAADIIGAPVTSLAATRAKKRLARRKEKDVVTYGDLKTINAEVTSRFHDELETTKFYCLNKGAEAFYNPGEPLFGKEADARIPTASNDISEAGKCFAVGRYTASIFHLMRAMEATVQRVSEELGIANVEREWGKLLSDIHSKIEALPKGEERNNWSQVHANLYHVKQAWRNETMHPKATYTEEEAREVFDAMRSFMRHLASMLRPTIEELLA